MAADHVLPGGGVGVLEVGHEPAGAGVQRVDDHLAVGGPGDLDPPVAQVRRGRGRPASRPRAPPGSRAGSPACSPAASARLALRAGVEQLAAAGIEARGAARPPAPAPARDRISARSSGTGAVSSTPRGRHALPGLGSNGPAARSGGRMGSSRPRRRSAAAICSAQPGLAAAMASAPVASRLSRLARAQLGGRLGLEQVVDAGRAAAQLPLGGLHQLEAGDARAAARAAGGGCPGRVPGGRRRGRRPAAAPAARGARGLVLGQELGARRAPWPANSSARSAQTGSSASRWP